MFISSLTNIALLLAMAIPGFIIAKSKMLKIEEASSILAVILLYVCQPFITFNSFLNTSFSMDIVRNFAIVFLFTAILQVVMIYVGKLIFIFDKDKDKKNIAVYAGTFGNVGYMSIPFLQILIPGNTEIILYATAGVVSFNLVAWTLGNYILTGDKKFISIKKAILNPPTLSFLIVLPLFIFNLNFIEFPKLSGIANIVALFNNMVGPLAMTLLGIRFAEINAKELLADFRIYLSAGVKLIIAPLIAFASYMLISLFTDISSIRLNLITFAAMPSANNLIMFCSFFQKDAKLATKLVVFSTILSIITIPISLTLLA